MLHLHGGMVVFETKKHFKFNAIHSIKLIASFVSIPHVVRQSVSQGSFDTSLSIHGVSLDRKVSSKYAKNFCSRIFHVVGEHGSR